MNDYDNRSGTAQVPERYGIMSEKNGVGNGKAKGCFKGAIGRAGLRESAPELLKA